MDTSTRWRASEWGDRDDNWLNVLLQKAAIKIGNAASIAADDSKAVP
jgi:hypothetical protein